MPTPSSSTIDLCCELISRPSVSPDDQGCQDILCQKLRSLGFQIEQLPFGEVSNFWARRGSSSPLLCFAGHTDVVPPGNLEDWDSEPFTPEIRDGKLYGRGSADMKASLAAMITACENFIAANPDYSGSIAFLITSDEESIAIDGTKRVIEILEARGEKIDFCIVGEPSSSDKCGDTIKNGRRGSLSATLKVTGQLGHVAYPHLAQNPIQLFLPALTELSSVEWDQGNTYFPATSFQISNINAGTGANNVIPADMEVLFNFRFSTEISADEIKARTEAIFNRHHENYKIDWHLSGHPFITNEGTLTDAVRESIKTVTGIEAELSTSGGTSDGRFIAPTGAQLVELGPCNASIHKINENVAVEELDILASIYEEILSNLLN
jgi:succinyl-diaminopimelate desuccinylase